MHVAFFANDLASTAQSPNDRCIGFENLNALPIGDLGGEASRIVHWADHRDSGRLASGHVIFPEARSHMNDACSFFGVYEFR